jgi:hypothetical protein
MTTKAEATAPPPPVQVTEEDIRHYTAQEVEDLNLLPVKARWLREQAYKRRIPHTKVAGKLRFRLDHLLAISKAGDTGPANHGRRAA